MLKIIHSNAIGVMLILLKKQIWSIISILCIINFINVTFVMLRMIVQKTWKHTLNMFTWKIWGNAISKDQISWEGHKNLTKLCFVVANWTIDSNCVAFKDIWTLPCCPLAGKADSYSSDILRRPQKFEPINLLLWIVVTLSSVVSKKVKY